MSTQLAQAFFERDLSEAEMDALEAGLDASPEAAEALLSAAEQRYRATGLPEPRWDERRSRGRGWLWALLALGLGAGAAIYALRPQRSEVALIGPAGEALPIKAAYAPSPAPAADEEAAAPAEPRAQAQPGADAHQQGRRLGVVLRLRESTELDVRVLDGQARLRRRLFSGRVEAGEHRYEWDGTDDRGRRVEPGSYRVHITGPGVDMTKALELRPALQRGGKS